MSFHCPIYTDWQSNSNIDSIHSNSHTTSTGNGTNMGMGIGTNRTIGINTGSSTGTATLGTGTVHALSRELNTGNGTPTVHTVPGTLTKQILLIIQSINISFQE